MSSHEHTMGEQDCSECGIVIACETCGACLGVACDLCDDCDHFAGAQRAAEISNE